MYVSPAICLHISFLVFLYYLRLPLSKCFSWLLQNKSGTTFIFFWYFIVVESQKTALCSRHLQECPLYSWRLSPFLFGISFITHFYCLHSSFCAQNVYKIRKHLCSAAFQRHTGSNLLFGIPWRIRNLLYCVGISICSVQCQVFSAYIACEYWIEENW